MKKIFLIMFALSVFVIIAFGQSLNITLYLRQFNSIPRFTDLIEELNGCWDGVGYDFGLIEQGFSQVNDVISFFSAFGQVFVALASAIKGVFVTLVYLPTKLLVYLIITIYQIIPHIDSFKPLPNLNV